MQKPIDVLHAASTVDTQLDTWPAGHWLSGTASHGSADSRGLAVFVKEIAQLSRASLGLIISLPREKGKRSAAAPSCQSRSPLRGTGYADGNLHSGSTHTGDREIVDSLLVLLAVIDQPSAFRLPCSISRVTRQMGTRKQTWKPMMKCFSFRGVLQQGSHLREKIAHDSSKDLLHFQLSPMHDDIVPYL